MRMISYRSMDEKLNELSTLVGRIRLEVENIETSNRALKMYWNSEAASEYTNNAGADRLFFGVKGMKYRTMNTKKP